MAEYFLQKIFCLFLSVQTEGSFLPCQEQKEIWGKRTLGGKYSGKKKHVYFLFTL